MTILTKNFLYINETVDAQSLDILISLVYKWIRSLPPSLTLGWRKRQKCCHIGPTEALGT